MGSFLQAWGTLWRQRWISRVTLCPWLARWKVRSPTVPAECQHLCCLQPPHHRARRAGGGGHRRRQAPQLEQASPQPTGSGGSASLVGGDPPMRLSRSRGGSRCTDGAPGFHQPSGLVGWLAVQQETRRLRLLVLTALQHTTSGVFTAATSECIGGDSRSDIWADPRRGSLRRSCADAEGRLARSSPLTPT